MRLRACLLPLLLLAGCLEDDAPIPTRTPTAPTPTPDDQPPHDEPAMRSLASGMMAGTREKARLVFTDAQAFESFWARVREDDAPAPEVDFARETVVAAVADARPNACWALRITNATASEVEVTTFRPPPDLMCASVITYPWHVVALSGAERRVAFVDREADGPPPSSEA